MIDTLVQCLATNAERTWVVPCSEPSPWMALVLLLSAVFAIGFMTWCLTTGFGDVPWSHDHEPDPYGNWTSMSEYR